MTAARDALNATIRDILRAAVIAPLAPHGFRPLKFGAYRPLGPITHFLHAYGSPMASADESDFTLECGIFVAGLCEILFDPEKRYTVGVATCPIYVRIGSLAPEPRDIFWSLRLASRAADAEACLHDIATRVTRDVLPWFERRRTLRDVARNFTIGYFDDHPLDPRYKPPQPRFINAAATYLLAGDHAEARAWTERIPEGVDRANTREELIVIRDRMLRIIAAAERGEKLPLPALPPPKPKKARVRKPAGGAVKAAR